MADRLADASARMLKLATTLPMSEAGRSFAETIATALFLERVWIWRFDMTSRDAYCLGAYGIPDIEPGDNLSDAAMRLMRKLADRRSVTILDYRTLRELGASFWSRADEEVSALLVPLHSGQRPIGAIVGYSDDPRHLSENGDLKLADSLGGVLAFAIEHVELRQASRNQLHASPALLDDLPLQVMAINREGILVYVNKEFVRRWSNTKRDRFVGRHYSHFVSTFRRESLDGVEVQIEDHPFTRALRGESVTDELHLVPTHFGTPRVFAMSSRPTHDQEGTSSGAVLISRDVTAEFDARGKGPSPVELLADARRKVELLGDLTTEIARRRGVGEIFRIVAERSTAVLGADACAVLTPNGNDHLLVRAAHNLPPGSEGRTLEKARVPIMTQALEQRELFQSTMDDASPSGRELLLEAGMRAGMFVPLIDEDQSLGLLVALYSTEETFDAVDQNLARAIGRQCGHAVQLRNVAVELESAHRRLSAVLDQLPQAVVIIDEWNECIAEVNREAETLWGARAELINQQASVINMLDIEGEPLRGSAHPFTRPLRTKSTDFGVAMKTKDVRGEIVDVVANVAPIFNRSGDLQGSVAVLQRREHFKPIDEAKDEFISVVAHELRNPLTSLRGNLQLLERRLRRGQDFDPRHELERVSGVIEQVDRIGELVSRMLDVSRAELGKLIIAPTNADAMDLVRSAIVDIQGQSEDRVILLEGPDTLPVTWDAVRVVQILVNLLSNAVRYAPEGEINVDVKATEEDIRISVRDHGPGVPAKLRQRLFRLYYRFDDGEETADGLAVSQRGLGIGLYISARLAKAHGGELTVDKAEGGGAIFTLTLPRVAFESE